jgi:Arc/MetJ family transcription regulator
MRKISILSLHIFLEQIMRTTIEIPDDLMATVLQITRAKSKRKAVTLALEAYAHQEGIKGLLALQGTMPNFMKDSDYKAARRGDLRRTEGWHADAD